MDLHQRRSDINGDLTISLAREPVGDWILLDAETWAGPDSIGLAAARLADRDGYFGRAIQSVLLEKRWPNLGHFYRARSKTCGAVS